VRSAEITSITVISVFFTLVLSACNPFTTIVSSSGAQPTPVISYSSAPAAPQERGWQSYRADSGFEIRYPLDAYSIRNAARPSLVTESILFPGALVVEPNDAFVYQNSGDMTYRITIAVTADDQDGSLAAQREQLLAHNPIAPYSLDALANHPIREVTLDGIKALRVDGVTEGPLHITAQIVALHKGLLFHLLVEPHELPPNQAEAYQPKAERASNKALVEEILSSFKFTDQ
jgi:hypothetical protein